MKHKYKMNKKGNEIPPTKDQGNSLRETIIKGEDNETRRKAIWVLSTKSHISNRPQEIPQGNFKKI